MILNGIDVADFAPIGRSGAKACAPRWRSQPGERNFVWIAVGRLAPAKDYPNLLRAFAAVRAEEPDAQLWVAGDARGDRRPPLQALANELRNRR